MIKSIIPNPFSKDSSITGLAKKAKLIEEGLSFTFIFRNLIFLIILGFILLKFFQIPISIVLILIGMEIIITITAGHLKIKKIKAMYDINTDNNAKGYRTLLITSEYYSLLQSIFSVSGQAISLLLIFIFFSNEISAFISSNISQIPLSHISLKYFIFLFLGFKLFDFFMKFIRYSWIKQLKNSDNFDEVNQDYTVIEKKLELIKFIPGMCLVLIILFLIKVPFVIPLIFGGFMVLILILSIVELKRIKNVKFRENHSTNSVDIDKSTIQHSIVAYQNEQIVFSIFGILKTATSFRDMFKPFGSEVLGVGKTYYPENTLFVTNYRLLLVQVPVTGGNKMVDGVDYVENNFFYNRSEIRQKGEQMIKTTSMSQILTHALNDFLYKDIRIVTLKGNAQLILEKVNGEKYGCTFLDKEYAEPLKKALIFYLKEKFIEK